MFKKRLVLLGVVAVVVCAIMIPPVQAAAESALSIFRVAEPKTIRITVNDLQNLMTYAEDENVRRLLDISESDTASGTLGALTRLLDTAKSDITPLSSDQDFTAFPFSLPTALKSETPELYAANSQTQTIALDTEEINAILSKLGASSRVDSSLNGTDITVSTPPAISAAYNDVILIATQNVCVDAPDDVMNSLWSGFLSIPAISEDLRAQLQAIDPKTRDVYLPVIEGLGRETDLGGATGYIYAGSDLAQVLSMLPGFTDETHQAQLQQVGATVLIWVKNGVLYYLSGTVAESDLIQIARSIR